MIFPILCPYLQYSTKNRLIKYCSSRLKLLHLGREMIKSNQGEKYAKIANVKRLRIHDLRHSRASLLIKQSIQPNIVQERLGHKKLKQHFVLTHIYIQINNIILHHS